NEGGEGRMTLTQSRPSDLITVRLALLKPFAATSTAEFACKREGNRTVVTWSMAGNVNFMAKIVHLFMDMDRMIGDKFEQGLARLKSITEAGQSRQGVRDERDTGTGRYTQGRVPPDIGRKACPVG